MAELRVAKSSKTGARKLGMKAVKSTSHLKKRSSDRSLERTRPNESQYGIHTDQSMKLKKFSSRQTQGWKPLDKSTQEYVIKILDEGIKFLELRVSSQKYGDIKQEMAQIRSKLIKKIGCLHAPLTNSSGYRNLSAMKSRLIQQRDLLSEQIDELHKAIEEVEVTEHTENQGESVLYETYSSLLSKTVLELPLLPSW